MGTHLKSWSVGVLTGAFCHLHRTKPEDSSDEDEKESMTMPTFPVTLKPQKPFPGLKEREDECLIEALLDNTVQGTRGISPRKGTSEGSDVDLAGGSPFHSPPRARDTSATSLVIGSASTTLVGGQSEPSTKNDVQVIQTRSCGIVRLTIQSAHMKKSVKRFGLRTPNSFVVVNLKGEEKARTGVCLHTYTPNWINETHFILISNFDEPIEFSIYDHHNLRPHRLLGTATLSMRSIRQNQKTVQIFSPRLRRKVGDILVDLEFHPALEGREKPKYSTGVGILGVVLHEAKNLHPGTPKRPSSTYAEEQLDALDMYPAAIVSLGWNCKPIHRTDAKDGANPIWDSYCERLCYSLGAVVTIKVVDMNTDERGDLEVIEEEKFDEHALGHLTVPIQDFLEMNVRGPTWWPLTGSKNGKVLLNMEWRWISEAD